MIFFSEFYFVQNLPKFEVWMSDLPSSFAFRISASNVFFQISSSLQSATAWILSIFGVFPYLDRIRENTAQKKLRIRTLFMQCVSKKSSPKQKFENIRKLKEFSVSLSFCLFLFSLIWYNTSLELITLWVIINDPMGSVQMRSILIITIHVFSNNKLIYILNIKWLKT